MDTRVVLDGYGKSRPQRDSIRGPSSLWQVIIPAKSNFSSYSKSSGSSFNSTSNSSIESNFSYSSNTRSSSSSSSSRKRRRRWIRRSESLLFCQISKDENVFLFKISEFWAQLVYLFS